jgi:quercetin dioxygenase-like cupin family protein
LHSLDKLRELTEKLPPLSDLVRESRCVDVVEYDTGCGASFGFNVWNEPRIAVQRCFMTAGCVFTRHSHEGHEWVIVYSGSLRLDGSTLLSSGDYVHFLPGEEHSPIAVEDCWMLCITIPAEEGYPGARQ